MSVLRLLVFGSEADLQSPFVQKLRALPNIEWVLRDKVPPPARDPQSAYQGAILFWKAADLESLSAWPAWLASHGLKVAAYTQGELPVAIRAAFSPVKVVKTSDKPESILETFHPASAESGQVQDLEVLSLSVSRSELESELPVIPVDSGNEESIAVLDIPAIPMAPETSTSASMAGAEPAALSDELLSALGGDAGASGGADSGSNPVDPFADLVGDVPAAAPAVVEESPLFGGPQAEEVPAAVKVESPAVLPPEENLWSQQAVVEQTNEAAWGQAISQVSDADMAASAAVAEEEADAEQAEAFASAAQSMPVMSEDSEVSAVMAPPVGRVASSDEYQTLQRYAALKEREAREKDAAIQAVNKQLEQIRERLAKSEAERRRLTMSLNDSEVVRRSLEDERDQNKHHLHKIEAAHQDELRAFQLRLDNTQFQASRAEKKLEDFRERVRADIQRIRAREREFGNRLELQKRDAEALLAAKDERLLQQKREIDRLEFEVDSLRERLIEQTQKAEERVARLSRALKALKMAQGMLSGMEDEVLPNAVAAADDGEEAA